MWTLRPAARSDMVNIPSSVFVVFFDSLEYSEIRNSSSVVMVEIFSTG